GCQVVKKAAISGWQWDERAGIVRAEFQNASHPPVQARRLVVAAPAASASLLLEPRLPELAAAPREVDYASLTVAPAAFPRRDLPGWGASPTRGAGLRLLSAVWTSAAFPDRAPEGRSLATCFLGGQRDPDAQ